MSGFFGLVSGGSGASGQLALTVIADTLPAGQTDNYNPSGLSTAGILRLSADAAGSSLSGLVAQTLSSGYAFCLFISNIGPGMLTVLDEFASSDAENRFAMPGDFILPPESAQGFYYDETSQRWRLLS